eukprot:scaffold546_cov163-Amphora_coffeaeformis.AAC.12
MSNGTTFHIFIATCLGAAVAKTSMDSATITLAVFAIHPAAPTTQLCRNLATLEGPKLVPK